MELELIRTALKEIIFRMNEVDFFVDRFKDKRYYYDLVMFPEIIENAEKAKLNLYAIKGMTENVSAPKPIVGETYEMNEDTWNMIYRRASLPDSQKPCDKTSHGCHIECDTVSQDEDRSCWTCKYFEHIEDTVHESFTCHHEDIDWSFRIPIYNCPYWENENNG